MDSSSYLIEAALESGLVALGSSLAVLVALGSSLADLVALGSSLAASHLGRHLEHLSRVHWPGRGDQDGSAAN